MTWRCLFQDALKGKERPSPFQGLGNSSSSTCAQKQGRQQDKKRKGSPGLRHRGQPHVAERAVARGEKFKRLLLFINVKHLRPSVATEPNLPASEDQPRDHLEDPRLRWKLHRLRSSIQTVQDHGKAKAEAQASPCP